jgi:hypothetical protein
MAPADKSNIEPEEGHPRDARPLTLATRADSPQSRALIACVFEMVRYAPAGLGKNRRGADRERSYRNAVEALIAGVLLNAGRHGRREWSYQRHSSDAFTGQPVAKRQFEAARNALGKAGLIERRRNFTKFHGDGSGGVLAERFATRYRATDRLLALCGTHGVLLPAPPDPSWGAHFRRIPVGDARPLVILRSLPRRSGPVRESGDALPLDTGHPGYVAALRGVEEANAFVARFNITGCDPIVFRRIFIHDLEGFGRWQASYVNLPKDTRKGIRIDGDPVLEVDVSAAHLTILHGHLRLPLPDRDDLYGGLGLPREVVKRWTTATMGAGRPLQRWPRNAASEAADEGIDLGCFPCAEVGKVVLAAYPFLRDLAAVWKCPEEPRIAGLRIMFWEAVAITRAMDTLRQQGIPALPLHDALIVRERERDAAERALKGAYRYCIGVEPTIR